MRNYIKRILGNFGYELKRKSEFPDLYFNWDSTISKFKLLDIYGITLIFDIGANVGQYGKELRENGYHGKIVSFEPLNFNSIYSQLEKTVENDCLWKSHNIAIGNKDEQNFINVSDLRGTGDTSSIYKAKSILSEVISNSLQGKVQQINVRKIDSVIEDNYVLGDSLFVKSDTQGYEKEVVKGALKSLDKIMGFELELSLVPYYEGESSFIDMVIFLKEIGYSLVHMKPAAWNHCTGQILQVDTIFFKTDLQPMKLTMPQFKTFAITKLGYPKMYF